jgi:hypothetical protein
MRPARQRPVRVHPETTRLKGAVIDPAQALVIAAALGLDVREN